MLTAILHRSRKDVLLAILHAVLLGVPCICICICICTYGDHVQPRQGAADFHRLLKTPMSTSHDYRFFRALAYRIIDVYGGTREQADLEELLKVACARTGASYTSETIRKAMDAALAVRRKQAVRRLAS